jgi:glycosyltransferase involved in cell wall biosynthesis
VKIILPNHNNILNNNKHRMSLIIKDPILSILIATKNRIPYCIQVIETILKFPDQDFELVIQDNSDSLELFDYVKGITDSRFVYNYTPPPFSSIDNFNKVISLSKGQYSCLIGDDDSINPDIFKIVRSASAYNIDSIVPSLKVIYWWPDATKNIKGKENANGLLSIGHLSSNVEFLSTDGEVEKLMKSGGQGYMNLNLPKLYHGVVKTKYLHSIKEKTGFFVGGLSPDINISVALASFIEKIVRIDYPLTISGICIASTSADSATGKNTSKLEDAPHFRNRGSYRWSKEVPKFYSGINIWADSALASLRDMKRFDLINKFDVAALTISNLKRHREYSKVIFENYFLHKKANNTTKRMYHKTLLKIKYVLNDVNIFFKRIIRIIKMKLFGLVSPQSNQLNKATFTNVPDIHVATNIVVDHLSKSQLPSSTIIANLQHLRLKD